LESHRPSSLYVEAVSEKSKNYPREPDAITVA